MRPSFVFALIATCAAFFPADISSPRVPTHPITHEFSTKYNSTVKYTVEHHENVISLEFASGLLKVTCSKNTLVLTFSNQTESLTFLKHLAVGSIVVGGNQLGCVNPETGKRSVVTREIKSVPTLSGSQITLVTKHASITQVLKNARTSINANPIEMQAMGSCNTGDLLSGHCDADLTASHSFQGWKYDYSGHQFFQTTLPGGAQAAITCSSCYAQFIPTLQLQLQITDNNLNMLDIQLQGAATVEVQIQATIKNSYAASGSVDLTTINLPSVTFFIGAFPVHLDFNVPITLDWSLNVEAEAVISTGVTANDNIMGGMHWDGSNWTPEKSNDFSVNLQPPTADLSASATFKVFISPKLQVTFESVCTVGIAVRPYVEIDVSGNNGQLSGAIYGGIDVELDGTLGVVIDNVQIGPQQQFGPVNIYDDKVNVWSS